MELSRDLLEIVGDDTLDSVEASLQMSRAALESRPGSATLDATEPSHSDVQARNLDTTEGLLDVTDDPSLTRPEKTLAAGHAALDSREDLIGTTLPEAMSAGLDQERSNLHTTEAILTHLSAAGEGDKASLDRIADLGASWQADALSGWYGTQPTSPLEDAPEHHAPSEAAFAILEAHDVAPTTGQERSINRLDGLDPALRERLTGLFDAFLHYEEVNRRAFQDLGPEASEALDALLSEGVPVDPDESPITLQVAQGADGSPESRVIHEGQAIDPNRVHEILADEGPDVSALEDIGAEDFARILWARQALFEQTLRLQRSLGSSTIEAASASSVFVPPALGVDLTGEDNAYTEDVALLVDAGGNDTYLNNAGGSSLDGGRGDHAGPPAPSRCTLVSERSAAALVDFDGDDRYGDPEDPRGCGVNGGGVAGSGFLYDAQGDDTYHAGALGVNGAGANLQFIGSVLGYAAGGDLSATDGGFGLGFLLDAEGSDEYAYEGAGANGAGHLGAGALFDLDGDDVYRFVPPAEWPRTEDGPELRCACTYGPANGGGMIGGVGFLVDTGGQDVYEAPRFAGNGGANWAGTGFLLDTGAGNDTYENTYNLRAAYPDGDLHKLNVSSGFNGGALTGGSGFLFDEDGNDHYAAGAQGTNGGSQGTQNPAVGFLADGSGEDVYTATGGWSTFCTAISCGVATRSAGQNGGAIFPYSAGFLLDLAGDDRYSASWAGNGGGGSLGAGFLLDAEGDDSYNGEIGGMNGGVTHGIGFLFDREGNDVYRAGVTLFEERDYPDTFVSVDVNGGASIASTGFLFDGAGEDGYHALPDSPENMSVSMWAWTQNGGAAGAFKYPAAGTLIDASGSDEYIGNQESNGGAGFSGSGFLLDQEGNDRYVGASQSNGGAARTGVGSLVDGGGDDVYDGGNSRILDSLLGGSNGGAETLGRGFLFDASGSDVYRGGDRGANGGAGGGPVDLFAHGFLYDGSGDDTYEAGNNGTNGGSTGAANGHLVDGGGDDRYVAGMDGVNGGAVGGGDCFDHIFLIGDWYCGAPVEHRTFGTGVLLDVGGSDRYDDEEGGSGEDRTVVPKGTSGAQIDGGAP